MQIRNKHLISEFRNANADSRKSLDSWINVVEAVTWLNFKEVRETYRSADYVNGLTVFNIGGNKYRLVARIDFANSIVDIARLGTHAEYDKWSL